MPAGRPLKPIDPTVSAAARLGAELRGNRLARGLTLHDLARRTGYTAQHISDAELAKGSVSETFVAAADRALGAAGRLLALYEPVVIERAKARSTRAALRRGALPSEDVKRRAFLGLGMAVVLFGPEAAARANADQWERIAAAWNDEVAHASDRQALMPGLQADLKRLAEDGGPQRAIAQLSVCAAMIALSSGAHGQARRWWGHAHAAARAHGDRELAAYVAGQHAYDGVYALYSPAKALKLTQQASAVTTAPCVGRAHALSARARAFALLGRKRDARGAVRDLEHAFEQLPRAITNQPIGGWDEHRLHHTASFVVAFGGVGSPTSHDDAAGSSPVWRATTQIELHRAAAEADAAHAVQALGSLSAAQRSDEFIRRLGGRTLATIEAKGADVAALRDVLA